jgi:hypothetical protein
MSWLSVLVPIKFLMHILAYESASSSVVLLRKGLLSITVIFEFIFVLNFFQYNIVENDANTKCTLKLKSVFILE